MSREAWNMSSDPSWNREVVDVSGPRASRSHAKLQSNTARVKADGSALNFTRGEKYQAPYKAVSKSAVAKVKQFAEVGQIDGETSVEWYNRLVTLTKDVKDINDPEGEDDEESFLSAYRISVTTALRDKDETRRKSALAAMDTEIDGLMGLHFGDAVKYGDLTSAERQGIIHAFMFMTEKKLGSGDFDKWKARLVAGGNELKDVIEADTYSPTANYSSVMSSIALAACEKKDARSYDVKTAYLIPDIEQGEKPIFIRIDKTVAGRLVERHPEWKPFLCPDGTLVVKLRKYLYGLPMAGKHWYDHLSRTLLDMGFERFRGDRCVFQRGTGADRVRLVVWVDDILATGHTPALDKFEKELKRVYSISGHKGNRISYLGLDISKQAGGGYLVSSPGTRNDILIKFGHLLKGARGPATPMIDADMANVGQGTPLNAVERSEYVSLAMSLMFLARMTRADLLLSVTVASTRSSNATSGDMKNLKRVLAYLAHVPNYGILYEGGKKMCFRSYVDSSHALHKDGRGHGGLFLTFGSGYVFAKSGKLKTATLSSTESENNMMCECATYILWMRELLTFFGYEMAAPTRMFQDNLSAIWLSTHDGKFTRNKHTIVKRSFFREHVESDEIQPLHMDTENMPADMGTKPLCKKLLEKHMKKVGMVQVRR
jgi:hypothetical protein